MKNALPPIITAIFLLTFGIFLVFALLLVMNGYSESAAGRALIIYGIWTLFTIILFGIGSRYAARWTSVKMDKASPWIINLLVIIVCSIVGGLGIALGGFISILATAY